jgi:aspartyl-tRNA(Asn)/glutamyl-tRNA(Gln) amidotransferase subunit C
MAVISEETIDYVSILAKLELSPEEKEQAGRDMGRLLEYIDKLAELDTGNMEPLSHVLPLENVFREDVVTNGDESSMILENAPEQRDNMFSVPRTF